MEKIIDNIHIKRIGYFNLYLIKGTTGDILIDTGFICMKKRIKKWLDKHNVKLIILTHAHIDHIWNVAYIKKLYNCKVAIGRNDIENIDNKNITPEASKRKYNAWTKVLSIGMKHLQAPIFEIDYVLYDKQRLNLCDINIQIHNLSGHTDGSIGISYKDYLFIGDALVHRFKTSIAFQNQNTKKAIKSKNKIIALNPKMIMLGHDRPLSYDKLTKDLR